MAKGKSSASSNTRKKHAAKKSGNPDGTDAAGQPVKGQQQPKQRGQKESKLSKAQRKALPKIKQYIPPPKAPAPPIPDPLDSQGLGRTLPPELVVVLRRLGKKDEVTRRKGVEELREGWVDPVLRAQRTASTDEAELLEQELKEEALTAALPVWLHHLSTLLHSASHRTPSLALFTSLLAIPSCQASIINTLNLGLLPGTQNRDIIGSWLVASLEEGRRPGPSSAGLRKWSEIVYFSKRPEPTEEESNRADAEIQGNRLDLTPNLDLLVEYLSSSILTPPELHSDLHPQPISSTSNTPSANSPAPSARVLAKALKQQSRPSAIAVPTVSSQTTEDGEGDGSNEEERWGRYRLTGLLGLTWVLQNLPEGELAESIISLLKNPTLWTCLSPLQTSPLVQEAADGEVTNSIGFEQPGVRRAGYALLAVLVEKYSVVVSEPELLKLLSRAVLGSCWVEKEGQVWETAGQSIVVFLAKHRACWEIAAASDDVLPAEAAEGEEDGDSESEEEEDDDEEDEDEDKNKDEAPSGNDPASAAALTPRVDSVPTSTAYNSFLSFLANICPAHPHYTYPLLLVIISTIPPSILPLNTTTAISNLFNHFWSPADARMLSTHSLPGHNNSSAYQVFLQSALDCAAYLTGRAWRSEDAAGKDVAAFLVQDEIVEKAWVHGVLQGGGRGGQRRLGKGHDRHEVEAAMVGKVLTRAGAVDGSLVDKVLPIVRQQTLNAAFPEEISTSRSLLPRLLSIIDALAVSAASLPSVSKMADALRSDVVRLAVAAAQQLSGQGSQLQEKEKVQLADVWQLLSDFMVKHPACIEEEQYGFLTSELAQGSITLLNNLSSEQAAEVFSTFTSLPEGRDERKTVAHALAAALSPSSSLDRDLRLQLIQDILSQGSNNPAEDGWLDDAALEITEGALRGDKSSMSAMRSIISASKGTISADCSAGILAMVTTAVHTLTDDLLCPVDKAESSVMIRLQAALDVLRAYAEHDSAILLSALHSQALVAVHHLARLIDVPATATANDIWNLVQDQHTEAKIDLRASVLASLAGLLVNTACVINPTDLVQAASRVDVGEGPLPAKDLTAAVLPAEDEVLEDLNKFASKPANITMPVVDCIVSYTSNDASATTPSYDSQGRSAFARHVEGLITLFYLDRTLASSNHGSLETAMSFACFAADELAVASSSRGVFRPNVAVEHLERIVQDVGQVFSYVLSSSGDLPQDWHQKAIQSLKASEFANADVLQGLLFASYKAASESHREIHSRVFRNVLGGILRSGSATAADAELWLAYGMSLCEKNTELAIAIITAVKDLLLDGKAYDQAQNRLASTLTGVSLKKANTQGVTYLRLLAASAPPPGAASTFIPQQRAMFVMRHVAGWLTDESDEADDLAEEVEARIAEVYTALAPIVQDVPGAHWDSIFDLIESSLEAASLADESTYGLLYQNLVLLTEVKDLCLTNKALRASWTSRSSHLNLVLRLFLESQPTASRSIPLEMIQEKLVDLLRGASSDVVETADYKQLSSLLRTSPLPIQRTAYGLLHDLTVRKTGQLVLDVEASVADAEEGHEGKKTIELAPEVVEVVKQGKGVVWSDVAAHDGAHLVILGQLLAWMTVFDHFEDASNTLRGAYLDQIRSESLVEQGLLPLLFEMLGISEVGAWNFPASNFAVDEFYIDLLEINELADLTPLASHVFYRSLTSTPSIVRSFFEACKDRQLSLSLLNFTSRHFSPVIIHHEFAALKVPAAIAQLAEEGLNVKVVTGGGASGVGSAEAVASYEIDEQPMEIGIRLPSDFPLKGVEVRDLRRVGVPENKWRGWLMGVQQLITSRNGLMLEALTVFKKNVALHFDGVVECAICYSIISLTDRTLPTKPCRTCKNRFHSSCLFKWFNSSHSSSCPMCRSLF